MNLPGKTCIEVIASVRRQTPAENALYLAFNGCRMRVLTSSAELSRSLADYFKPFVAAVADDGRDITITVHEAEPPLAQAPFEIKPPDPGKQKIKEAYLDFPDGRAVRKRLTGMVFLFTSDDHLAVGPCMENLNQIVNFINNRFIQQMLCEGRLLGHAAGVSVRGKGLAMAGFSGAGKSTLALEMMREPDCVFISNDRLMIRQNGDDLEMTGVAKLPRINPGTALNNPNLASIPSEEDRKRFSALPESELWDLEYKYDVPIDQCFGPDRFMLKAPMHGLVLLNWKRTRTPLVARKVNLGDRRDLLPAIMKSTGLFFLKDGDCRMPEPTEQAYIDMLSRCDVWEFSGGADFQEASRHCKDLLDSNATVST